MKARIATLDDAAAIADIYNQGIATRLATFETEPRSAADIARWFETPYPVVVVEDETGVGAFAATSTLPPA